MNRPGWLPPTSKSQSNLVASFYPSKLNVSFYIPSISEYLSLYNGKAFPIYWGMIGRCLDE
jgi:hypothetical protein